MVMFLPIVITVIMIIVVVGVGDVGASPMQIISFGCLGRVGSQEANAVSRFWINHFEALGDVSAPPGASCQSFGERIS